LDSCNRIFSQSLSDAIKAKEQAEKKLKELKKDSKKTTNQPNYYRVCMLLVINITEIDSIFVISVLRAPKHFSMENFFMAIGREDIQNMLIT
jgi:hypothetical protein